MLNRIAISIGISGYRILTEIEKVERGVDEAVARIEAAYPEQTLTILSSLAEGSDRLVVRCVLTRVNARLTVPLPLLKDEYLADFTTTESKQSFRSF